MDIHTELITHVVQPQMLYEASLVAMGALAVAGSLIALKFTKPLWEARAMRVEQEKKENTSLAAYWWQATKDAVENGDVSVNHAETVLRRVANILPDVLPKGNQSLKQMLEEKHPLDPNQPEVPVSVEPPKVVSLLARLTAAKRQATA